MDTVLQIDNLTKFYGKNAALHNIHLQIPSGKIVGLLGPNGSGKTTMIKIIAGVLSADYGNVLVCNQPVGPKTKALVSYLPDRIYFSQNKKVNQLLNLFEDFYSDFDRQRAEAILTGLGIDLNAKFKSLSKGNKEKVQLALVMSRRASLYLLDEPIAGVDPAARDYILRTVVNNYAPEASVIISTHLIADVEAVLDEYVFVHNGNILQTGTVDQLREETGKSLDQNFREVFRCLASF